MLFHGHGRSMLYLATHFLFAFALSKFFSSFFSARPKSRSYRDGFGVYRVIRTIISMELIKTNTVYYFDYYCCGKRQATNDVHAPK